MNNENNEFYPDKQRLESFIFKRDFDIQKFFIDLFQGSLTVRMYVNRCDLYVLDKHGNPEHEDVELQKWKDVYPQSIHDLFYTNKEVTSDFLKTNFPYEEYLAEGSYYKCDVSLSDFGQLFLTEDVSAKYFQKFEAQIKKIILKDSQIDLDGSIIPLNEAQHKALKFMIERSDMQQTFSNIELADAIQEPKMVGLGSNDKFDFSTVFRKGSHQAILIDKKVRGFYRLGSVFGGASILLGDKEYRFPPWKSEES